MNATSKWHARLDLLSSIAVLVAAGAVVWAVALKNSAPVRPEMATYKIGERVDGLPGSANTRLILFVQSNCRFCTESMDFYKSLREQVPAAAIVAVGYEPEDTIRAYLSRHKLDVTGVLSVKAGSMKIAGTPTLLLVDRTGILIRSWRGRLPQQGESEVLEALKTSFPPTEIP